MAQWKGVCMPEDARLRSGLAQWVRDPPLPGSVVLSRSSIHEDAGLVPGLTSKLSI